ncbi:MAG: amino acid adenylation domain-containing protein [Pseudomonadota bacterium]
MTPDMVTTVQKGLSIKEQLARLDSLEEKRRFLISLKKRRQDGVGDDDRLKPFDRTGEAPLSFTQERLWFLDQIEESTVNYNISGAMRIRGALNEAVLHQSLKAVVHRHESLRTIFESTKGIPRQTVLERAEVPLNTRDFSSLPEEGRVSRVREWVRTGLSRSFVLDTWPLMEVGLARIGPEDHVFVFSMHHIISDGWSVSVFLRELGAFYAAFCRGSSPGLPELPVQYLDYSLWQRRLDRAGHFEEPLRYWTSHLRGAPETLNLPADIPIPLERSIRGGKAVLAFNREHAASVAALAKGSDVTPFMIHLALYYVLLNRTCGEEDVCIGTPVACRNRPEMEGMIGCFANTLALRIGGHGDMPFTRLLAEVKKITVGAYENQDVPFARIIEAVNPGRNLRQNPLFQVMLVHQAGDEDIPALGDLEVEPFAVDFDYALFDLNLVVRESRHGIRGHLEYRTDIVSPDTAGRMADHYIRILEAVSGKPGRAIGDIPLLRRAEREQLLAWNRTGLDYDRGQCIQELFQDQAARTPRAEAVICGKEVWTYARLNARANQLARYLKQRGVGPETRVGLFSSRKPHLIAAMLAVFKSGGAYVPIDPAYPRERVRTMLDHSGVKIVLTETPLARLLGPDGDRECFCLDRDWPGIRDLEDRDLPRAQSPENLAYVMYTSGSTGQPKGVAVEQRNVRALIASSLRLFRPEDFRVTLGATSICFDVSVFEIFCPLSCGGALLLVEDILTLAEGDLSREPAMINAVPSAAKEMIRDRRLPAGLRHLVLAGEALSLSLVREANAGPDAPRIHNIYGPTETTVYATGIELPPDCREVTIGRPLPNTRATILDKRGQPAPPGIWGELYIAGHHVARGYFNRPDLTAMCFVPDPLVPGDRMYRTGDRCRFTADGRIEYGGRLDLQIKVRGFRIEPGEIEARLQKHPDVKDAAVNLFLQGEDKRLVAYVIPRSGKRPGPSHLRAFLMERLPDYMVPSRFVFLDVFPFTPSGKLDRRRLPPPEETLDRHAVAGQYVPPGNEVEKRLSAIWEEVLNLRPIGVHDNFFEIGGDSILSIQIVSRARAAGLPLKPRHMFTFQTIAELARMRAQLRDGPEVSNDQGPFGGEIPLAPIQRWFFDLGMERPDYWNQALLLEVEPGLDPGRLEQAFAAILRHHDQLRARFSQEQGGWKQVIFPPVPPGEAGTGWDVYDLSGLTEDDQGEAVTDICRDLQAGLSLADGRTSTMALFRLGRGQRDRLFLAVHHLSVDGVSWRILLEDLTAAYVHLQIETPVSLPARTSPYGKWTQGLIRYALSSDVMGQRDTWLKVAGTKSSGLPGYRPEGRNLEAFAHEVFLSLDREASRAFLEGAMRRYRTSADALFLAVLVRALASWTEEASGRWVVSLEGHGRDDLFEDLDLSRTVGWFTTLYPVLLEAKPGESPAGTIRRMKQVLRTVPGKGIGFGLLRPDHPELGHCRPGISFNYLGRFSLPPGSFIKGIAAEDPGPFHGPDNERPHLIDINALSLEQGLRIVITYGSRLFPGRAMEELVQCLRSAIAEVVDHSKRAEGVLPEPKDFPGLGLNREMLNTLSERGVIQEITPLTPMQQGMLFHTLEVPESRIYFQHLRFTARSLDPPAFRKAWEALVQEEPLLRTGIAYRDLREPVQVVYEDIALPLEERDLTGLEEAAGQERLREIIRSDREQALDMDAVPLFRLSLIRLDRDEHLVIWNYHHLLLDGWSLSLLMERLFDLYRAFHRGIPLSSRGRDQVFGDYVRRLQTQDSDRARDYWRAHLKGMSRATMLGLERHSREGYLRKEKTLSLGRGLTQDLQSLSRGYRVTLSTLFQAAFSLLLHRYAGEDRVCFGITLSGRSADLPDMERMIGLFINTLPLCLTIDPGMPLTKFLKAVQETVVDHSAFEHSRLRDIRRWSGFPPDQQLFNAIMIFENYPVSKRLLRQTEGLVRDAVMEEQSNYPLTLAVLPGDDAAVTIVYDGHVYDDRTVDDLMEHWRVLFQEMARKPGSPLGDLEIFSPGEKDKILFQWNDRGRDFPDTLVTGLFEQQAGKRPGHAALLFGDRRLGYGDLNRRANRLAHLLRSRGVGPECLVGICLPRCPEMIIAMLAIMKAGAAYLPLDPEYPPERLRYMLEDSGAQTVITVPGTMPARLQTRIVHMTDTGLLETFPDTNPTPSAGPHNLAYVIYTSGSTGSPKGVALEHRGLSNLVFCERDLFDLNEKTRTLQFFSFSFDGSVWEIFATLSFGGTLVLAPKDRLLPGPDLEEVMTTHGVTWTTMTPTALSLLRPERVPSLETVVMAGEAAGRDLFEKWRPHCRVYNAYGPTEATVGVSCMDGREMGERVSIGRPLPNLRLHVLDRHRRPVPPGVPGELAIGGPCLARGYIHQPDLTAEKFIPDPFSTSHPPNLPSSDFGGRLYRTGDLARYLPDGTLELLGRMDNQIKVRGFRIEAGEVEAALERFPGVDTALVVPLEEDGRKSLAAYLLSRRPEDISPAQLRIHLQEDLPDYMIPSLFVIRDAFPLTPGGKIDRRRLPEPEVPVMSHTGESFETEDERTLAQIWKQVLRVGNLGREDDFFELGGDSILSIQIAGRANMAGFSIRPRDIFLRPTIARLATLKALAPEEKITSGPKHYPVPLTPVQDWFFGLGLNHPDHWNQSLLIRLRPGLSTERVRTAFSRLYRRHDMLRVRFYCDGDTRRQEIPEKIPELVIEEEDLKGLDEEAITRRCSRLQAGLDMEKGRLLAAALFRTGEKEDLLFIAIHHLVVDAVSWRILLDDLNVSLSRDDGETGPGASSFKTWAEHLLALKEHPEIKDQEALWRKRIQGEHLSFIPDHPEEGNLEGDAQTFRVHLDPGETEALLLRAKAAYRTRVDELLLSALIRVLGDSAGSGSWLIGLEGHGRQDPLDEVDTSRTVGWFTALFPLALACTPGEGVRETILRVKDALRSLPGGGIGFGLLGLEADIPIVFNYLGRIAESREGVFLGFSEFPTGPERAPDNPRPYELAVNALVMRDRLHVAFEYGGRRVRRERMEDLARSYEAELKKILGHCLEPENSAYTPSDFPMAGLDQSQMDALTRRYGRIRDISPLSPVQEGMLFHSLEKKGSGTYFQHMRYRMEGVDIDALKKAWEALVEAEPVLRTAIVWQGVPAPLQVVTEDARLPLYELDWRGKDRKDRVQALEELCEVDRLRGFDLAVAPMMRLYLIHLTDGSLQVVWNFHHIILDGWSTSIIMDKLLTAYEGYASNRPAVLPGPEIPFREVVAWIASRPREPAKKFWQEHLKGAAMPFRLGAGTAEQGRSRMEEIRAEVGEVVTRRIREQSGPARITLNAWIQAAWALLLSRLSGREKVVFGTTLSGRSGDLKGIETMTGMLLNTLPVCLRVRASQTVEETLIRARDDLLNIQEFEYTPLTQISRWLGMPRAENLFDSILVLENYPALTRPERGAPGFGIFDFKVHEQTNYPLTLVVLPGETLDVRLRFDASMYRPERAGALLSRFTCILGDMAENTLRPLSRIRDGEETGFSDLSALPGSGEEEIL